MIKYKTWVYRNLLFLYYMFLFLLPITSQLRKQVYTLLLHTTSALHICLESRVTIKLHSRFTRISQTHFICCKSHSKHLPALINVKKMRIR